jgi:hypothetical protein
VSNTLTHLIYSHHHADHAGASSLFDGDVARIGHEETRKLLLRDDDPARPAPEETFQDRRALEIGGDRIELARRGAPAAFPRPEDEEGGGDSPEPSCPVAVTRRRRREAGRDTQRLSRQTARRCGGVGCRRRYSPAMLPAKPIR